MYPDGGYRYSIALSQSVEPVPQPVRVRYYSRVDKKDTLLEFPCDFPIKAMGLSDSGFEARALEIVRRHAPDFSSERMYSAASKQGKYISVTFTLQATSQAQLDAIYRGLTSCDDIVMVL